MYPLKRNIQVLSKRIELRIVEIELRMRLVQNAPYVQIGGHQ
jgi:hypothetical protein